MDNSELIRSMREARGLSRAKLGEMAGVSQYTIRAYEREEREPTTEYLQAILWALKQYPVKDVILNSKKRPVTRKDKQTIQVVRKAKRAIDLSEDLSLKWHDKVLTDAQVATVKAVAKTLAEDK